ncbi:MAG: ATP-binding cassette domain-containing protein [Bdellovibrionota bacterium]
MKNSCNTPVELKNVSMKFGSLVVHKDISFAINKGESVTILGPSGSGKTLILKMIIGLLKPTSGEVKICNHQFSALDETELREVRKKIGMLFQSAALFDSLSVFENIAYSLKEFAEHSEEEIKEIVHQQLQLIGLPGIENKKPPELSGGQKKRVGLARALASKPEILLFDEPTTGLDPTTIRLIDDLIIRLNNEFGITCISVTHDIESAKRISDRWLLINDGMIASDGKVEDLKNKDQNIIDFITGNWKAEISV